jgi:hypothetical protein
LIQQIAPEASERRADCGGWRRKFRPALLKGTGLAIYCQKSWQEWWRQFSEWSDDGRDNQFITGNQNLL